MEFNLCKLFIVVKNGIGVKTKKRKQKKKILSLECVIVEAL